MGRTVSNKALYLLGAMLGYWALMLDHLFKWAMGPFCRTRLGRAVFVRLSRSPVKLGHVALLLFAASQYWLYDKSDAAQLSALGLTLAVIFLNIHRQRVLTINNQGNGRWSVHLNVLKRDKRRPGAQWAGAMDELSDLVSIARVSDVRTLSFESPLLVHDVTARRLMDRLSKVFGQQGVSVRIEIASSKAMGAFRSGLFHPLRRYQRGLKSHRVVCRSPMGLLTRRIEVRVAQGA
ncbi:hypothetical protein WJ96_07225 [Burkholderia ubonensis]|uniref:Uncharacterized protein n=2 Tax=Burkholderia ubonensis TaxID=101571 RepID=A0AAW3MWZ6_9BURK|nr:hypothetical protein WJ93_09015 [Burkholderia ubonensis]KVP96954.1 hypothetical protein WJ97_14125 [Burkholderia ubonensis]KVP98305.1 hypothetical protein WJ96_07225 [Burkholderia ubonensis]KVZ93003.1 hypothetical protein WL25_18885 [Burkholderia ubonensis]